MLSIAWVLLIIIITVLVAVILYRAIRENRVQYSSNANSSDPVSYEVLIESLEAETGLVQATLGLRLSQMALLSPQNVALLKEVIPDLPEPHPGTGEISFGSGMSAQEYEKMILSAYGFPENQKWDVKVLFTPQRLVDSTSVFRGVGLLGVQVPSLRPSRPMVPAKLMDAVPSPSRTQLHALGDPWRYPFDRYLVMGKIWGVAYLRYKDQYALLNGETYTISFRLPGYVVKSASVSLLSNWPPMLEPFLAEMLVSGLSGHVVKPAPASLLRNWPTLIWQTTKSALRKLVPKGWEYSAAEYDPERWKRGQFVFVLERPAFFRIVTVLLGFTALISIIPLVWITVPSQFLTNAVAYFLALWALRSVLSSGAPKVPTYVDYGALILYVIEIAAMVLKFALKHAL